MRIERHVLGHSQNDGDPLVSHAVESQFSVRALNKQDIPFSILFPVGFICLDTEGCSVTLGTPGR
jgi:hypothetical protein